MKEAPHRAKRMGIRKCVPADALTSCRISWKKTSWSWSKKKNKKEKGKHNNTQETGTGRRTIHIQKECMWCMSVCVCLTFDLFYEVFFLSEVLSQSYGKQPL